MRLRLVTGVGAAAIVVGAVWLGAPLITLLALIGGSLAIREAYRLTPPAMGRMPTALGITAVVALLLASETAKPSDFHLASGLVLLGMAVRGGRVVHRHLHRSTIRAGKIPCR